MKKCLVLFVFISCCVHAQYIDSIYVEDKKDCRLIAFQDSIKEAVDHINYELATARKFNQAKDMEEFLKVQAVFEAESSTFFNNGNKTYDAETNNEVRLISYRMLSFSHPDSCSCAMYERYVFCPVVPMPKIKVIYRPKPKITEQKIVIKKKSEPDTLEKKRTVVYVRQLSNGKILVDSSTVSTIRYKERK